jgi:acyl-CoA thioesterase-1
MLFLFGDSICFGQLISSHATWASKLATKLDLGIEKNFVVQNAGVNGNTTRLALERLSYDILSHQPKYVLVQFGMNDCNYWKADNGLPRVMPDSFRSNLIEIIQKLLSGNVRHVFLNTNHPSAKGRFGHIEDFTYDESNEEYNKIIRSVASEYSEKNLTLIDIELCFKSHIEKNGLSSSDFLLPDGVHLNQAGHNLYAERIIPIVFNYLSLNDIL